ncbi:hypothetical protein NXS98_03435 [Fontisphaera persica]|uniref:hypothetical protein n=1 Tax=Fontisphaera persica TaxID=2974023 RepID=UPI0024C0229D|nr:hypothetical protein [Fontisphaera persica]WCJ60193.1 hypothetical protein NXS98_03435 [Fontisphaera persica]
MKSDILKEFTSLRAVLEKERDELQRRLNAINAVLSGQTTDVEKAFAGSGAKMKRGGPKALKKLAKMAKVKKAGKRGPRKMSEAAKARIAAAQRERWAKIRAQKAGAPASAAAPEPTSPPSGPQV